jgi:hypothetical protein
MHRILELLNSVDLVSVGAELRTLIEGGDPLFLTILLGMVNLLGWKMASPYPALRSWGLRLAAAAFLLHAGYAAYQLGGLEQKDLPPTALRSLLAANLVLAPLWILLPILAFVYAHLRLVLAAFLLYGGYACFQADVLDGPTLGTIALRALAAAGLALVAAWILQPVLDFVRAQFPVRRQPAAGLPDRDVEAGTSPRRTEEARLEADLLYAAHGADIIDRLEHRILFDLLRHHRPDALPPRAEAPSGRWDASLLPMCKENQSADAEGRLAELTRWFLSEQKRLENLEGADRDSRLRALQQRYQALAEQLLEPASA